MKKYFILFVVVTVLLSCGKDNAGSASIESNPTGTTLIDSANFEMWIDGIMQEFSLFRVRKANGESRMRLLADMPDFVRFSLFVTPFELGSQQIESGNVSNELLKFSRTHIELRQQINETQFYLFEVDTTFAFDNSIDIIEIDSIQRIVAGRFRCHMKNVVSVDFSVIENILIQGNFRSTYLD
jgi:hypothetical protein